MRPISSMPAPDEASIKRDTHQDWNGVSGPGPGPGPGTSDNSLSAQETEPNCDPKENSASSDAGDPVAKAIEQRSYRLQEIVESEQMYVSDLEQVYTYITYMRESKETEDADIPMPD